MTFDEKAVRAMVAQEAQKQPLRVQMVHNNTPEVVGGAIVMSTINLFIAGLWLMLGFKAAHYLVSAVPPAGYVDSVMLVFGFNALGAALGWTQVGVLR